MTDLDAIRRREGFAFFAAFAACVPIANWLIGNIGTICVPGGPCLVPVAPGILAPSGVMMIGLALVLRDMVQRRLGLEWSICAIFVGAVISAYLAPPTLVMASASAFLLSEFVDLSVYTPLQRRGLTLAVLASGIIGLVVDSIVFLYLAFGNFEFLLGQVIGKFWMVVLALPFIWLLRRRDARLGFAVP